MELQGKFPLVVKYIDVAIIACMWKWYYYAPNTLKEQHAYEAENAAALYRRQTETLNREGNADTLEALHLANARTRVIFDTGLQAGTKAQILTLLLLLDPYSRCLAQNYK